MQDLLPYTVPFEYQPQGICVAESRFPILKMEWVEGVTLDRYIEQHKSSGELVTLRESFQKMRQDLQRAGIAHGDLQHGNILVLPDGSLRLVDYDGMYVPEMQGMKANELGHRHYQHPGRRAEHFGPDLDQFSFLVIETTLDVLIDDYELRTEIRGGNDYLLFRDTDFRDPDNSVLFARLQHHSAQGVRQSTDTLMCLVGSNSVRRPNNATSGVDNIDWGVLAAYYGVQGNSPLKESPQSVTPAEDNPVYYSELWWKNHLASVNGLEKELTGPVPRSVRRAGIRFPTVLGLGVITCFSLFDPNYGGYACVAVLLIVLFFLRDRTQRALVVGGIPVRGQIIRKFTHDNDGLEYHIEVCYPWETPSIKSEFLRSFKLWEHEWCRLKEGESITVLYMKDRPDVKVLYPFADWQAVAK